MQTLINRIGPVKQKMSSVEQEKQQAVREREESESDSREEIDSLKAKEQAIQENNRAITRWTLKHTQFGINKILSCSCNYDDTGT